jgi:hypothetical protein
MRLAWSQEIDIAKAIHAEHQDQGDRGIGFLIVGAVLGALMWVGLLSLITRVMVAMVG